MNSNEKSKSSLSLAFSASNFNINSDNFGGEEDTSSQVEVMDQYDGSSTASSLPKF